MSKVGMSKLLIPLLAIICPLGQLTLAGNNLDQWRGSAQISGPETHHYKAFFLNQPVYENCRPDLADLRIVDGNHEFVPYIVVEGYGSERESETIYPGRLIKEFKKKANRFFDFQISPPHQNVDITGNEIKLALPAENFLKKIEVYGSYDGIQWEKIGSAQVYRVDDLIKDRIDLSKPEKFSYYRIIILNNTENIQFQALQLIDKNLRRDWAAFQRTTRLNFEIINKTDHSLLTINNSRNLKIKRLSLAVTGNFNRKYLVYSDRDMEQPLQSGFIYNLKFQDLNISETAIELADNLCSSPVIKLKIINLDNRPLRITDLQIEYYIDQIIFEDSGTPPYRLYFGNSKARHPVYDMEFFRPHILKEPADSLNLTDFRIAKPKTIPADSKFNLSLIFNIVIVGIALFLIVFLVKKFNRQTQ